jgi:hypothetical protein
MGLLGPIFLWELESSKLFRNATNFFNEEIDHLLLNYYNAMYFQHYLRIVRDWLSEKFGEKWIGRNGPILWPLEIQI